MSMLMAAADSAYEAGRVTGMVLGLGMGGGLVYGFIRNITGADAPNTGRNRRALLALLAVYVGLIGLGLWAGSQAGRKKEAWNRLLTRLAPVAESNRRAMEAGNVPEMAPGISAMVGVMKDFAKDEEGTDLAAMAVCMAQSLETILPGAQKYDESMGALVKMGGWDASSVAAKNDAAKRLALVPKAAAANKEVLQALRLLSGVMRQQLGAAGYDELEAGSLSESFLKGARMTQAIRVHEIEEELLKLAQAQLRVLRDYPGQWKAVGARAEFTGNVPPEAMNAYTEAAIRADQLVAEERGLVDSFGK